jgi:hypothetical protein
MTPNIVRRKEARRQRTLLGLMGDAALYEMTPAFVDVDWEGRVRGKYKYVVVVAYRSEDGPETAVYPADSKGQVLKWCEMRGSFIGRADHALALARSGYALRNTVKNDYKENNNVRTC